MQHCAMMPHACVLSSMAFVHNYCDDCTAADMDMMRRVKVMDPPLKEQQFLDVLAVHGKRTQNKYLSGTTLPDDASIKVGGLSSMFAAPSGIQGRPALSF